MSTIFKTGLYKCGTCKEICAEPEALQQLKDVLKRVLIHMDIGDELPVLLKQDIQALSERFKQ